MNKESARKAPAKNPRGSKAAASPNTPAPTSDAGYSETANPSTPLLQLAEPAESATSLSPHNLLAALQAVRAGDFSVRLPGDRTRYRGEDRGRLQRDHRHQ